jgi:site-specific recombinase XerD
MTVRLRGNKFQADFMVKGIRHRAEFESRDAAEAWELESRAKLLRGQPIEKVGLARPGVAPSSIKGLVDYATEHRWKRSKASITLVRNAALFCQFVGPALDVRDALTRENIQAYAKQLEARGRSDGTVNRHLSAISVLCKIAVDLGQLDQRPGAVTWHRREAKGRTRFLDEREEAALLQTLRGWGQLDLAEFYEFLIDTGARLSEALKLQWRDVHENKRVMFHDTKNGEDRAVPLMVRSQAIMARRRADPLHGLAKGPWENIDPRATMRLWPKLVEALPFLEDCVPHHVCRHTRASRFAIAGHDLVRIKQWMGHKNINTTMRYANLRPKHLEDMVA